MVITPKVKIFHLKWVKLDEIIFFAKKYYVAFFSLISVSFWAHKISSRKSFTSRGMIFVKIYYFFANIQWVPYTITKNKS